MSGFMEARLESQPTGEAPDAATPGVKSRFWGRRGGAPAGIRRRRTRRARSARLRAPPGSRRRTPRTRGGARRRRPPGRNASMSVEKAVGACVGVQRGKVHRDHPGQPWRGVHLLARVLDGERQPPRLALDVVDVGLLVAHLAARHRRRLGGRPQPRAGDRRMGPIATAEFCRNPTMDAVRLEQTAELGGRVAPPVVVVPAEEDLLARTGVEPGQVVRHLCRSGCPGDVAGDDDRVVGSDHPRPTPRRAGPDARSSRSGPSSCRAWTAGACLRWRRGAWVARAP